MLTDLLVGGVALVVLAVLGLSGLSSVIDWLRSLTPAAKRAESDHRAFVRANPQQFGSEDRDEP